MKNIISKCKIIKLNTKRNQKGLTTFIQENEKIPFKIKRVYYLYNTKKNTIRGLHRHKKLNQLLVCINGKVEVTLEANSKIKKVLLSSPNLGLLIYNKVWREIKFKKKNTIILVLASEKYLKTDYIYE